MLVRQVTVSVTVSVIITEKLMSLLTLTLDPKNNYCTYRNIPGIMKLFLYKKRINKLFCGNKYEAGQDELVFVAVVFVPSSVDLTVKKKPETSRIRLPLVVSLGNSSML